MSKKYNIDERITLKGYWYLPSVQKMTTHNTIVVAPKKLEIVSEKSEDSLRL